MSTEAGGMNGIPIGKDNVDRVDAVRGTVHTIPFRPFIPADVRLRELSPLPLIVGTILNLINQGDAMLAGLPLDIVKLLLTYLVPYLVSTYGAVSYRLHAERPEPKKRPIRERAT